MKKFPVEIAMVNDWSVTGFAVADAPENCTAHNKVALKGAVVVCDGIGDELANFPADFTVVIPMDKVLYVAIKGEGESL